MRTAISMSRTCPPSGFNGVSVKEAVKIIEKTDKERSDYYRHYTGRDWTNAKNYNLCLDTSDMSYDKCVDIIKGYIKLLEE